MLFCGMRDRSSGDVGLDCGDARRPGGRPLSASEYDAYIAKVEALGIFRKDDALKVL